MYLAYETSLGKVEQPVTTFGQKEIEHSLVTTLLEVIRAQKKLQESGEDTVDSESRHKIVMNYHLLQQLL